MLKKHIIKNGDFIILASDGIVDSFDNVEEYSQFINNERVINSQMLADNILEEAECRESLHQDDKTVIVIKVNENIKRN